MKKQKLYAYLDVESAYQLAKGNMQAVGQVYRDDPQITKSYALEEGKRYVFLMGLPQLFRALSALRQNNIENNNSGGIICEFDLSSFDLKMGTFGYSSYNQLREGMYVPSIEERAYDGVHLTGCFSGNFVFDVDCTYKKEEIIEMFRKQNREKKAVPAQLGANE